MRNLHILAVLIIALCSENALAQSTKPILSDDESVLAISPDKIKLKPVVYGKKKDGLPHKIEVRGVIEDVSIGVFSCGIIHWHGTVKIKLLDKVKGYKPEYVYVVATCFFTTNKETLNKVVEIKLSKLRNGKMPDGTIVNIIDSNGIAFYRLNKIQSLK